MRLTLPGAVKATAVISAVLLAVACESAPGEQGGESASQKSMKVCRDALGAKDVEALKRGLGDDVRVSAAPSSSLRHAMLEDARRWESKPTEFKLPHLYERCLLTWYKSEKVALNIRAHMRWSYFTMDMADQGVSGMREIADGIYSDPLTRDSYSIIFPCRVAGSPPGQRAGLPLEIEFVGNRASEEEPGLPGRVVASLARDAQKLLGCKDSPRIPDRLSLPKPPSSKAF
ncbi:hypothetical protein ACGFRB_10880 [Streptomyces sp. NPDC048718]|uniref:hypothetical protein n=1 Tax=Streptomyces sp. NPDC048718 TaxID=3365587 RepID=UPI00371712D4